METKAAIAISLVYIVLQTSATPVTRQQILRTNPHCSTLVYMNNLYYTLDERINVTGIPADIAVHWKTGNVYFTLINEKMKMSLYVLRPGEELESIKTNGLGQSAAVDNFNDIVYLATDNGIMKFKDVTSTVEMFAASGEDVMYIGITNDGKTLYIATWPQNKVHKITNEGANLETFSNIPNGHGLTIDTKNNIYFVATKTPYILRRGEMIPIKILDLPSDKMTNFFVSRSDAVYAMDEYSNVYVIDDEDASAKKLGSFNIEGVNSFAMDAADNILIGVKNAVLKYKVFERNPCPQ